MYTRPTKQRHCFSWKRHIRRNTSPSQHSSSSFQILRHFFMYLFFWFLLLNLPARRMGTDADMSARGILTRKITQNNITRTQTLNSCLCCAVPLSGKFPWGQAVVVTDSRFRQARMLACSITTHVPWIGSASWLGYTPLRLYSRELCAGAVVRNVYVKRVPVRRATSRHATSCHATSRNTMPLRVTPRIASY